MTRSRHSHKDFHLALFRLSGVAFGIDVKSVKEVVRYVTPVGRIPAMPFMDGFITLRGLTIPVIDLRKRFSLKAGSSGSVRIIIAAIRGHVAGLAVDEVIDVSKGFAEVNLAPCGGSAGKPWSGCVGACVEAGGEAVNIIDLDRLLAEDEALSLKAPKEGAYLKA